MLDFGSTKEEIKFSLNQKQYSQQHKSPWNQRNKWNFSQKMIEIVIFDSLSFWKVSFIFCNGKKLFSFHWLQYSNKLNVSIWECLCVLITAKTFVTIEPEISGITCRIVEDDSKRHFHFTKLKKGSLKNHLTENCFGFYSAHCCFKWKSYEILFDIGSTASDHGGG